MTPFSMLGLGDIVIPGIFVALVLRYDTLHDVKYFRRWGELLTTHHAPATAGRTAVLLTHQLDT